MPRRKRPSAGLAPWAQDTPSSKSCPYQASPLTTSQSFRLLKLRPPQSTIDDSSGKFEILEADLTVFSVEEAPKYAALSYSWKNNELEETLHRNLNISPKCTLPVSTHLAAALKCLRSTEKTLYFWIDAICINQDDADERSSQIRIMYDIYASAAIVYVWLGQPPLTASSMLVRSERPSLQDTEPTHIWVRSTSTNDRQESDWIGIPHAFLYTLFQFDRPWWRRKWVLQEIIAAKREPIVLYGGHAFELRHFQSAIAEHVQFGGYGQYQGAQYHLSSQEVNALAAVRDLRDRLTTAARDQDSFRWLTMLAMTRTSQASDPHDHIYAVHGLMSREQQGDVNVDYTLDSTALFAQLSALMWTEARTEESFMDIDTLCLSWHRLKSPSWVCDFSRPIEKHDMFRLCWSEMSPTSKHAKFWGHSPAFSRDSSIGTSYRTKVHKDTTLHLYGLSLGHVTATYWPSGEVDDRWDCVDTLFDRHGSRFCEPEWNYIHHARQTVMFALDSGHLGMSERYYTSNGDVQVGDCVVHLIGSSLCMVLRPKEDDCYILVKPCLISNDLCGCREGGGHRTTDVRYPQQSGRTGDQLHRYVIV